MNEKNSASTALGYITIALMLVAAILWGVGSAEQNDSLYSDSTAGLWQLAAAGGLFQLGAMAGLLWLVVRAIVAQLAYKPAEQLRAERSAESNS